MRRGGQYVEGERTRDSKRQTGGQKKTEMKRERREKNERRKRERWRLIIRVYSI